MSYQLAGANEAERQQVQALVWEEETGRMLDAIGIEKGWSCLDLGCGAMGILGPLSRRVGPGGSVTGIDADGELIESAMAYADDEDLENVTLFCRRLDRTDLPLASFDLVHTRWVLAHVSDPEDRVRDMVALARPGGVVAIQEPDHGAMTFYPESRQWLRLRELLMAVVGRSSDPNVGRRAVALLRQARLEDVRIRAAVVAVTDSHPYMEMPLLAAPNARDRIVEAGLSTAEEMNGLLREMERLATDPETVHVSLITVQAWGRKGE
jgi:SAM-dependent methyltransferase